MKTPTFENFDKFNRKAFAERLTKAITTFYPFYNGAYVLSLNAKFGSGKTTFLQMWKSHLEEKNFKVVYLNCWESDFDDEPLVSISTEILGAVQGKESGAKKAKSALRGVTGVAALVGNSALATATGINVKEILEEVEKDLEEGSIQKLGDEVSKAFTIKKLLYEKLKTNLSQYLNQLPQKPLVVLVDELDRARPDYAVKFLEAIKHIFSVQGVCFVLAVDRQQLQASVKQLYGEVDFDNYYRRFVTREANLPDVKPLEMQQFMELIKSEYFDSKEYAGVPILLPENQRSEVLKWSSSLCYNLGLLPRQVEHFFRIFVQFLAIEKANTTPKNSWLQASLFMIALSVSTHVDTYKKIGMGKMSPNDFVKFVDILRFNKKIEKRIITLNGLAFSLTSDNSAWQEEAIDVVITMDSHQSPARDQILRSISKIYDDPWGELPHQISGFQNIYSKLEEWKDFLAQDN